MTKNKKLLKFLKIDARSGKLTYRRQIPKKLRPFVGGRASIRRTLDTDSTDCRSTSVLSAYAQVHSDVEAVITAATARAQQDLSLMQGHSLAITAPDARLPLSRREIAGIAGQVLLDIRNAVADQQLMSPEFSRCLVALAIKFKTEGLAAISIGDFAVLARPVLNQLQIQPSPVDLVAIGQALLGYMPVMQADMQKLAGMDFSPPKLETIAPPLPHKQTTWADLLDEWRISKGGVVEVDGVGVSERREEVYQVSIKEFTRVITDHSASAITIANARAYIRYLQTDSGLSPRTQQHRITCLKHLLKIGVRAGLVQENVFADQVISTPAGTNDERGYRAFTKAELIMIFTELKTNHDKHHQQLCYILLCTGCRLNDALQLRSFDLQRTDADVWFFNWKHDPSHQLPMLLKSRSKNNRQTPLHPRLIAEGITELDHSGVHRLLGGDMPKAQCYSHWFRKLLIRLGIWEPRKLCLHSIRGSAKDLQREAGMTVDQRMAMTAHTSRDIGESSYGEGLQMQPSILYKHLALLDLSWLP